MQSRLAFRAVCAIGIRCLKWSPSDVGRYYFVAHPSPWRLRVGQRGWRRVNELELFTAASTDGVPRTRDARSAEQNAGRA